MSGPATVLSVDGLVAGYGGPPALEDVSFAAGPGQRIGVLGPNGGGKSTLFNVLLGELEPVAGTVAREGRPAFVAQTERPRLDYPVSALDVAMMGALSRTAWWRPPGKDDHVRGMQALEQVGLRDEAVEQFGELSGGQRQRVLIARGLVQDAPLILLDEPFSGVDGPAAALLMSLIDRLANEGRTLLIATHDIEHVRRWDFVLCLNRRQVAFGAPAETLTLPVLEATYGGDIVMLPGGDKGQVPGLLPAHHHDNDHGH